MTNTKRVGAGASGGATKRVGGIAADGSTKRVGGAISAAITYRVNTGDVTEGLFDPWHGSWGKPSSWGMSWIRRETDSELHHTKRVPSGAVAGNTKRVSI